MLDFFGVVVTPAQAESAPDVHRGNESDIGEGEGDVFLLRIFIMQTSGQRSEIESISSDAQPEPRSGVFGDEKSDTGGHLTRAVAAEQRLTPFETEKTGEATGDSQFKETEPEAKPAEADSDTPRDWIVISVQKRMISLHIK